MANKWSLSDNGKGEVLITKGTLPEVSPVEIFSHKRASFSLLYDVGGKMQGYSFSYNNKEAKYKFSTFNSFGVFYYPDDDDKTPKMSVLFEDSTVRLLEYENYKKIRDYFLIGRWRTDVSLRA